jgi:ATP-dependent DNA helicase RecG
MRGRVGRGDKPGFCFLVNDKSISMTSQQRLQVIEANSDGFVIAEEDLKIRGEGDIFGKEQSGEKSTKYLASIIEHQESLNSAMEDVQIIKNQMPQLFKEIEENLAGDDFLLKTI